MYIACFSISTEVEQVRGFTEAVNLDKDKICKVLKPSLLTNEIPRNNKTMIRVGPRQDLG